MEMERHAQPIQIAPQVYIAITVFVYLSYLMVEEATGPQLTVAGQATTVAAVALQVVCEGIVGEVIAKIVYADMADGIILIVTEKLAIIKENQAWTIERAAMTVLIRLEIVAVSIAIVDMVIIADQVATVIVVAVTVVAIMVTAMVATMTFNQKKIKPNI